MRCVINGTGATERVKSTNCDREQLPGAPPLTPGGPERSQSSEQLPGGHARVVQHDM